LSTWIKKIHEQGSGFIWWGMSFNGKKVDYEGIKTIGSSVN